MLSLYELKKILNPKQDSTPEDDFRIIQSWAEYDEKSSKPPEERNLKYLCYELEVMNPDTGEITHFYKAIKFARVIRLPANAKQSTAFMDMQEQILAGVHERNYNMITIIANVIKPVALGLLYLYGIQGVAESLEKAKEKAYYDFKGFVGMLQGTFRVLEIKCVEAQETEWLREKMYNMDYMTVVRGIPKANKAGEDAGNRGMGGSNINPDSQGTLEEMITGMADYEYVIEVLSIESNAVVSVSQVKEKKVTEKQKKEAAVKPEIPVSTPAQEPVKNEKQSSQVNPSDMSRFFAEHAEEFMKFMMQQAGGTPPVQEPAQPEKSVESIEPEEFKQNAFPYKDINEKKNMEPAQDAAPETGMDIRSRMEAARKREEEENRRNQMAERKEQNEAMQQVEEDLGHVKKPAKVITVFSAKGGVGKTTIACELATFLSLTNHGKGKFRVCLVDYDLMFGDILSTLNFNPNQANMMDWIADLDKKHKAGQEWNAISYDAGQIERFLQKKEESGLYSLIAPITNFDYMKISNEEIVNLCGTMLRNIVENGDFDFVIVDTGNNIEDATYVSLERADEILLILTQSMNSANCNNNFLNTMNHLNFDLSKIRIVINKAKPAKGVGISVNELQEALKNPVTNQPFECYAKIKDNDAVQNAENVGEPMVYKSSHEFTKSIGEVAHHVIGDTFVLAKPKKKRFSFFRKNK